MKRLFISLVIFASVLISCIVSVAVMKKSTKELICSICLTRKAYLENSDVSQQLEKLTDQWDKHYMLLNYITADSDVEDISRSVSKLPCLLKLNTNEFLVELESIKSWAQLVYERNFPCMSTIF